MLERGAPNALLRNLTKCRLAFPSTGGRCYADFQVFILKANYLVTAGAGLNADVDYQLGFIPVVTGHYGL